jgi:hypothetical protein
VANWNWDSKSSADFTKRMPRPPPPALAFINKGKPISSASFLACSKFSTSSQPGITGTSASFIVFLAMSLSPILAITEPLGPMKVIPFSAHKLEKSGFSDKKP